MELDYDKIYVLYLEPHDLIVFATKIRHCMGIDLYKIEDERGEFTHCNLTGLGMLGEL